MVHLAYALISTEISMFFSMFFSTLKNMEISVQIS